MRKSLFSIMQQGIEAGFSINKSHIGQHYSFGKNRQEISPTPPLCAPSVAELWPLPDPT